jgi:hypothetical protein
VIVEPVDGLAAALLVKLPSLLGLGGADSRLGRPIEVPDGEVAAIRTLS